MENCSIESVAYLAKRELTCWRDREYDDKYDCLVSTQGDYGVSLKISIDSIRFPDHVAQEIARCLYDAVFITVGNIANFVPTPAERECILQRKYRKRVFGWVYTADGKFSCHETTDEIRFCDPLHDCDTSECYVGVNTIDDGGIELVVGTMGYSFSMLDAVWLVNALMDATGGDHLDVLETMSMICSPQSAPNFR
ncbi:hypothetical protein [Pseudomonas umsongensis]|uniref:hypothetical protein n=1 Tax=Pseudomonas umsongensis TaxID=198618 RepID=UPI00200A7C23|nr:hypothetical protein [Pseudomonas umsongensis]